MSAQPEVTRLVPGDGHVHDSSSTSSAGGGGAGQLPLPNQHSYVGRTPSTSSCTPSVRTAKGCSVHIKEPPETDTGAPSSGPPTASDGDDRGPLHHAIPVMPLALAVTCCVLNILLPGIGLYAVHFSSNHLIGTGSYSATSNNMKLVH